MPVSGLFKSEIEKAQAQLDSIFGDETLLSFRDDLCEIYVNHRDESDATEWGETSMDENGKTGS
ncbi:hypothetical protein [Halorarum salinum]|uniref:Uncharacterized protein n=1 Tax=Halorarum salinum TaxID=2743089 RepID=A0A7D5QD17_9EURY|nr:hypothetical protein [Halobaculum salinum]QLG63778.1 hypothetical protein HUG12_19445 [Halobaculum salinum]